MVVMSTNLVVPTQLFIGGAWRDASVGEHFTVFNPSTGEVLAHVADGSPADGEAALSAAAAAQPGWSRSTPRERSDLLRRAFELIRENGEQLAALITAEMGKTLAEARAEVAYGAEYLRWFAEQAIRPAGHYGPNPEGSGAVILTREPVGPSLLITPWNFPLAMATRKVAPALAAGCTAVVKPAELTPLTTLAFVELLRRAGLPDGVVNAVPTSRAADLVTPLMSDPRLRKVSFTGSTAVGRPLLAQAAPGVLRTSMELGGNAPFIVFEDADLERSVDGIMLAKFRNSGQACTAANRLLVHEDVVEPFVQLLAERVEKLTVGPGSAAGISMGPVIDERAHRRLTAQIAEAVEGGARVLARAVLADDLPDGGHYVAPVVLTNVPAGSPLGANEIFGPILVLETFATDDEAVLRANDTEYGLVSYAYTKDLDRAHRLIRELDSGMVGINVGIISNAAAPFGGVKASGLGREGGEEGIAEYESVKYALIGGAR